MERYEEVLKAIFFVKLLYTTDLLGLADNVRRYVQLPQCGGGEVFAIGLDDHGISFSHRIFKLSKNLDTFAGDPSRWLGQLVTRWLMVSEAR